MRTLNTSLPGTSPPKMQPSESPEQLLQAFKTAALSVTNLYKSAAQDHTRARTEGYQDALDDLLAFLDKEELGLSDGEGWQIRGWATERLDGRETAVRAQESDDEAEQTDRGSSPVLQRAENNRRTSSSSRTPSPSNTEPSPPTPAPAIQEPSQTATTTTTTFTPPSSTTFNFHTSYTYPSQDSDMNLAELNLSDRQSHESTVCSHTRSSNNSRVSRNRLNGHSNRPVTRTVNSLRGAAGQKRKAINLEEYWNIDDLGSHGKDGFGGGGKRGRFS